MNGDFKRQLNLFDPDKYKNIPVVVIGTGGIGSGVLMGLAKMGVSNITVYDDDLVEKHNIPNQFYRNAHIGSSKIDAAKELVKSFSPSEVKITGNRVKAGNDTQIPENSLVIFAVDSLKARKELLTSRFMANARYLIDARMGGNVISIYNVDPEKEEDLAKYAESLDVIPHKTPCAAQAISYTILMTAGIVCSSVRNAMVGNMNPFHVVFDAQNFILDTDSSVQCDESSKRERSTERV